jgi:hypothetical protein
LLAEDVALNTPTNTPTTGKRAAGRVFGNQLRFRSRAVATGAPQAPIAWREPTVDETSVTVLGSGAGGEIKLEWTFDAAGKITRYAVEGAPELTVSFLLGNEPPLQVAPS